MCKLHRLEENIAAADIELSATDRAEIQDADETVGIQGAPTAKKPR